MGKMKVGVLLGSNRIGAFTKCVANCVVDFMPSNYEIHIIKIDHLPLYNQDYDADYPKEYIEFKEEIESMDALLFITPEHNRSIPTLLKNALDIGSRPVGKAVWSKKPAGIISVSPGPIGAFGANHHLRQVLTVLNVPTMQQPECYLGNIVNAIVDDTIANEGTLAFLKKYVQAYTEWIDYMKKY